VVALKLENKIAIISLFVVAILMIGAVYIYTIGSNRYSSDASVDNGMLEYSVSAADSKEFSVTVFTSADEMTDLYIYYDGSYASTYEDPAVAVGAMPLTQEYYIQQLISVLDYRGINETIILNASDLAEAMANDTASGHFNKGLVVISGALPDTVYQGNANDPIFSWLNDGGRLYWAGNLLGKYISSQDGITEAGSNYQELFFGAECLNTGDLDVALSDVKDNGFQSALSILNNHVKYGVDAAMLSDALPVGYSQGDYSSIVLSKYGDGMICVFGGDYSNNQRTDIAQTIASNISYSSEIIYHATGIVKGGTQTSSVYLDGASGKISVYIYMGGYYTVYGKSYSFTV